MILVQTEQNKAMIRMCPFEVLDQCIRKEEISFRINKHPINPLLD